MYIYICMYIYIHLCIYIYIYTYIFNLQILYSRGKQMEITQQMQHQVQV